MTIRFESTKKFEKELSKFPSKEKDRIALKLNKYSQFLESEPEFFYKHAYQPIKLKLADDNESSLYALRVDRDIRIIMTVDDDPLFDRTLITLLHVVRHSHLNEVFKSIAKSIYQKNLNSDGAEGC
jgi:mRNA-degrading endonuclease RelE of RelBE toxin-antitoxin system